MVLRSKQIEIYQISKFKDSLSRAGLTERPPQGDFEVYRARLGAGELAITSHGKISYTGTEDLDKAVEVALQSINGETEVRNYQRFVVVARPQSPPSGLKIDDRHLNVWLTLEQYYAAIEYLSSLADTTREEIDHEFIEIVFIRNGHRLEFHKNGKIISKSGFHTFGPLIREIIQSHLPFADYDLVIGQDEVGNGERLGPIVIGGVVLNPEQMVELQLAGIKDSKMIPRKVARAMSPWIRDLAEIKHIWKIDPADLNRMKKRSINEILAWGHSKVFQELIQQIRKKAPNPGTLKILVIVDRFEYNFELFGAEFEDMDLTIEYLANAETKSISVAAASVYAKAVRSQWLSHHEKILGISLRRRYIHQIRQHSHADDLLRF